jgi:hypothetical protein
MSSHELTPWYISVAPAREECDLVIRRGTRNAHL